jgi:acetylornithine deacetylase/succinyl-diaminopimelate desuccinylase-like protein
MTALRPLGDVEQKVLDLIDPEALADLALRLSATATPTGGEAEVGELVLRWLHAEGIAARMINLLPDRPNVLGVVPGTGGGQSLIFNSHLDVGITPGDDWILAEPERKYFHAWRDGNTLHGQAVVNDKGPMAAFMIAAKAIRQAGVTLPGDLLLSAVSGEIGVEPVDEFQSPAYLSKEAGTRYLVNHGGVADFALVAETSNYGIIPVEAGKAFFKIALIGAAPTYTPYLTRPASPVENPRPVIQLARLIPALEEWAVDYECRHRYEWAYPWGRGTVVPKAQIGAVRAGVPWKITKSPQIAAVYVDVRTVPGQDPLAIRDDLIALLGRLGLRGRVELYAFRPGYQARGVDPLVAAVGRAQQLVVGRPLQAIAPALCSMWRDLNVFNEVGIPAISYGPGASSPGAGTFSVTVDDLAAAARIYALVALDVCGRVKSGG